MYDELVKRLKEDKSWVEQGTTQTEHEIAEHIQQAADAIEELSAYAMQLEDLRKDGYYLQKTKMMTYGQATMTMPLPQPPNGEG